MVTKDVNLRMSNDAHGKLWYGEQNKQQQSSSKELDSLA